MAYLSREICDILTEDLIEKLNDANIWTVNDFYALELPEIRRLTGVKLTTLKDIREKVKQRYALPCHDLNFIIQKSLRASEMYPTGIPELTQALDGGFTAQEIVEFFGESECGKTELCYLLCGEILSHHTDHHVLYIASSYDFDHNKVAKYTRLKSIGRDLSDDEIYDCLQRIDIAQPSKLTELVHLLNTIVHSDRRNKTKCIIIDSLSFILLEDLLDIRVANLDDPDDLERFCALKSITMIKNDNTGSSKDSLRKELVDIYLHEVMRLLSSIAITKNVAMVITNSEAQLTYSKSYTNAIHHRIELARMPDYSRYRIKNPQSTVCRATILKTIYNIGRVGYTVPFGINDDGLFAIRLTENLQVPSSSKSSSESPTGSEADNDTSVIKDK